MPRIFISYRREDSIANAGRLYDRLAAQFGKTNVFMDVDTLQPGVDFVEVLQQTVASCDVLLVVIGKQWLKVTDEEGNPRLSNPEDFVRLEIAAGLQRDIRVVPLLVAGARMPGSNDLPDELSRLARRHAMDVPDVGFHQAVNRLIESLEQAEAEQRAREAAEAQRKAASQPPAESADWAETFDFEKLLREGREKARSTGKLMWIAGGSAAALIILSGLLVFPGIHRTKRGATVSQADASDISLRVERVGGELLLTWNRDSELIRGATHAVLSIVDGDRKEGVDLDLAQLRNGSIVYAPSSGDIVFQLTVTGKNSAQTQSESIRVLPTKPTPMPDTPAPALSKPIPAKKPGPALNRRSKRSGQLSCGLSRPIPWRSACGRRDPSDLPDAPVLASGRPQSQEVSLPGNPAAPVSAPAPTPSVQAIDRPRDPRQPRVGGQVREPQILTQTQPEYPLAARQARASGIGDSVGCCRHRRSHQVCEAFVGSSAVAGCCSRGCQTMGV